jgi:hypothetical protein
MKAGDKLLCKTSLSYTLHQGYYYEILNIEEKPILNPNEIIFTIKYHVSDTISFSLINTITTTFGNSSTLQMKLEN